MKILLVTPEVSHDDSPTGGLANFIRRFSISLRDFGQDVKVLTYGIAGSTVTRHGVDEETVAVKGPKWMTALDLLTFRILATSRTTYFRARTIAQRVADLIRQGQVDIVQYANLDALALVHPKGAPCVTRYSSDTLLWKSHGGYDLSTWWAIRQRHAWETAAARKSSAIYAPSALIARAVGKRLNRPVDVIRPPVFFNSTNLDHRVVAEVVGDAPFLLFVGAINRLKGIPILSQAIGPILGRHPDLHLVVVGEEKSGPAQHPLSDGLREGAGNHADRLHFTGVLPQSKLFPFVQKARAIVLPFTHRQPTQYNAGGDAMWQDCRWNPGGDLRRDDHQFR